MNPLTSLQAFKFSLLVLLILLLQPNFLAASNSGRTPSTSLSRTRLLPLALAAPRKKNKNNKTRGASTNRGFGAPPPSWQEVASGYKTRKPRNALELNCPCGLSSDDVHYKDCCAPYHDGEKFPETPSKVLQTRYSAFVYRLISYVIDTTHPNCEDWRTDKVDWVKDLNRDGMFDNFEFVSLTPQPEEMVNDDEGYVEFQVVMKGKDGSSFEGDERIIKERSQFLRNEDGKWTYATGEISMV